MQMEARSIRRENDAMRVNRHVTSDVILRGGSLKVIYRLIPRVVSCSHPRASFFPTGGERFRNR